MRLRNAQPTIGGGRTGAAAESVADRPGWCLDRAQVRRAVLSVGSPVAIAVEGRRFVGPHIDQRRAVVVAVLHPRQPGDVDRRYAGVAAGVDDGRGALETEIL